MRAVKRVGNLLRKSTSSIRRNRRIRSGNNSEPRKISLTLGIVASFFIPSCNLDTSKPTFERAGTKPNGDSKTLYFKMRTQERISSERGERSSSLTESLNFPGISSCFFRGTIAPSGAVKALKLDLSKLDQFSTRTSTF